MSDKLVIREATPKDRRIIWTWWNDPTTRKMMKKNDYVEWSEHCAWFDEVLRDEGRILCVGHVGSRKIGNVRFDRQKEKGVYEVSINLNPRFRDMGFGARMLTGSIDYLAKIRNVKKLFAVTKKINIPSRKTFMKAGFVFKKPPGGDFAELKEFAKKTELYCELNFEK